jgi:hypothetical protein
MDMEFQKQIDVLKSAPEAYSDVISQNAEKLVGRYKRAENSTEVLELLMASISRSDARIAFGAAQQKQLEDTVKKMQVTAPPLSGEWMEDLKNHGKVKMGDYVIDVPSIAIHLTGLLSQKFFISSASDAESNANLVSQKSWKEVINRSGKTVFDTETYVVEMKEKVKHAIDADLMLMVEFGSATGTTQTKILTPDRIKNIDVLLGEHATVERSVVTGNHTVNALSITPSAGSTISFVMRKQGSIIPGISVDDFLTIGGVMVTAMISKPMTLLTALGLPALMGIKNRFGSSMTISKE